MLNVKVVPYWRSDRLFDHGWTVTVTFEVPMWARKAWDWAVR